MTMHNRNFSYQPHIDGLRAIAVIAVILFHAGFDFIKGGYLGVDIFFTISGFLITTIITRRINNNEFNFKQFYLTRIRRIYPALISVILISTIIGSFILDPSSLLRFAKSAISAIFAMSNFYFAKVAGYWDTASDTKPLLHTWSLGVEEQFYIFWPLLLFLLYKEENKKKFSFLILGILACSILVTSFFTAINKDIAFYWSIFRLYEFVIGAIIALNQHSLQPKSVRAQNILGILAILALLNCFYFFKESILFPGYYAILPTIATGIIIISPNNWLSHYFLSRKSIVWLGKISYSLYLTHWPIFAFYRYINGSKLSHLEIGFLLLATFVSATSLYYFIETPLRYSTSKVKLSDNSFIKISFVTISLVFIINGFFIQKNGLLRVTDDSILNRILSKTEAIFYEERRTLWVNQINCKKCKYTDHAILIGDSHGLDGFNIFKTAWPEMSIMRLDQGGCPPLENLKGTMFSYKNCAKYNNEKVYPNLFPKNKKINKVILAMRLSEERLEGTKRLVEKLSKNGYTVYVLGMGFLFKKNAYELVSGTDTIQKYENTLKENLHDPIFQINNKAKKMLTGKNVFYLDRLAYFCPNDVCNFFTQNNNLVVWDAHHMTLQSAEEYGRYIKNKNFTAN